MSMIDSPRLRDDPIGFVLDALWATATSEGPDAIFRVIAQCVQIGEYGVALAYALAVEIDRAKRDEANGFWNDQDAALRSLGVSKESILDEIGNRTLFAFLARHINDHRLIKGKLAWTPPNRRSVHSTDIFREKPIPPPPPPLPVRSEEVGENGTANTAPPQIPLAPTP